MKEDTETNVMSGTMASFILVALVGMLLPGCATDADRAKEAQEKADIARLKAGQPVIAAITPHEAQSTAMTNCATAIKDIATAAVGDPASKVAAVGAIERLCGQGAAQLAYRAPEPQTQSLGSTLWQAVLQASDIVLRGYGIKSNRDVAITQSNNATALGVSTNGAFTAMGQSIATAGTAGYQYVQAPGSTNYTLSGTGSLNVGSGSASYVGPVTRNCQGGAGQAAAGASGTATIPGVPGGAAPGGPANC